jgi:hypothetical protein
VGGATTASNTRFYQLQRMMEDNALPLLVVLFLLKKMKAEEG